MNKRMNAVDLSAELRHRAEPVLRICHLASGDLWAGAEVQLTALLRALGESDELDVSAVVLNKGRLADELRTAGVAVTVLDESSMNAMEILFALRKHFRQASPDIVHTHRYKEHILGAFAAKLSHNPIVIQTYHGLEENLRGLAALKMAGYSWLSGLVANCAARAIVGVSDEIAAKLRRRVPFGRVCCIRNGLDLRAITSAAGHRSVRQALGIPAEAFVVGSVGRLVAIKGIEYLIRAFRVASGNDPSRCWRLVIVGEGPLRKELECLAEEQGVAKQVLFLGERRDVPSVMKAFDVCVLPSLHEGVPMVLLEAMAVGVPVVATKVGGIPEVVADGKEAMLVPAQDIQAIAKAVNKIVKSRDVRERMVEAARCRVEAEFSIRHTAFLTENLYRELAATD